MTDAPRSGIKEKLLCVCLLLGFCSGSDLEKPVFHGNRLEKRLALTFDACPTRKGGGYDQRIIQILKESGTPATFFLSGLWVEAEVVHAQELAREPLFELGNHGYAHTHMPELSEMERTQDLSAAQTVLERIAGRRIHYFRPPFGEWNNDLVRCAGRIGLITIQYDLASGDPDPNLNAAVLAEYILRTVKNGSIVVMHVNGRGWHTAEALPMILHGLKERSMSCVRLSELLSGRK